MKEEEVNGYNEMDDSFLQELKKNPFSVPDNYFDDLYHQTISETRLITLKNKESFKIDAEYFSELESRILAQTNIPYKADNDFSVPEGYFDKLSQNILEKVEVREKQKTRIFKLSFIKYAAAAVILLVTTFGAYNNYYHSKENLSVSEKLAKIPDQDILDYLNTYSDTNDIILILEDADDISAIEENISHL